MSNSIFKSDTMGRKGRLDISLETLYPHLDHVIEAFSRLKMVALHSDVNVVSDTATFYVVSPLLPTVEAGEKIPEYQLTITAEKESPEGGAAVVVRVLDGDYVICSCTYHVSEMDGTNG